MRTILVIYRNSKTSDKKVLRQTKHYCFNTKSEIKVGDMVSSEAYNSNMQVVKVLDKEYKYYNSTTGDLSDDFTSTAQREIATLEIREDDSNVVYGSIIKEE